MGCDMTSWILNCELPPPLLMDMKLIRRGRPPASSTLLEPTLKQMFEETPKHFIAMLTGLEEAYQARLSRMIDWENIWPRHRPEAGRRQKINS